MGVAVWQPGQDPTWRYYYGPRWIVGSVVKAMAVAGDSVYLTPSSLAPLNVADAVAATSSQVCRY